MAQAMGSSNPLWWGFPLAGSPRVAKDGQGSGWIWEENGFNREEGMWPPPDPEKIRRAARAWPAARRDYEAELRELDVDVTPDQRKMAFKERQDADNKRRRRLIAELEEDEVDASAEDDNANHVGLDGTSGWANSDGERLRDYGVDEDTELTLDDDVPLAELVRRRNIHYGPDSD
jgi:palmitoyltransferase